MGDRASDLFISGYLAGVFECNKELWEKYIRQIYNSSLASQLPFIVLRSGITLNIEKLLRKAAKENVFDSSLFGIFIYGGVINNFHYNSLLEVLKLMVKKATKESVCSALEIIGSLIYNNSMAEIISEKICFDILSHSVFFTPIKKLSFGTMVSYTWSEIAIMLAKINPKKGIDLVSRCLMYLGEDGTVVDSYKSEIWKFLDCVTRQYPEKIWPLIAKNIDPMKSNSFTIMQWLREGINSTTEDREYLTFDSLPKEEIFKWIDESSKNRAVLMSHFTPFKLTKYNESPKSFIREMIERYGVSEEVRNAVSANYHTESWVGSSSQHFQNKINILEDYKLVEKNKNVLLWLEEEILNLMRELEHAKIREEREG